VVLTSLATDVRLCWLQVGPLITDEPISPSGGSGGEHDSRTAGLGVKVTGQATDTLI
jgi:hypothetical protein